MGVKATFGTGIVCPDCECEIEYELKGMGNILFTGTMMNGFFERIKIEGGVIKCNKCGCRFEVKPAPKPLPWYKRWFTHQKAAR